MRTIIFAVLFSMLFNLPASAQTKVLSGNNIPAYIDQFPAIAANPQQAYEWYYPKGKKTACKQVEEELRGMINALADQAAHQSRLLSMLAQRYDKQTASLDYSKAAIVRDKKIDQLITDFNSSYFYEQDKFLRAVNAQMDMLSKAAITGIPLAEKQLAIYRDKLPAWSNTVKSQLKKLDDLLTAKGYNTIIDKKDSTHPNYVQLLEVRGLMLDRLLQLLLQTDGVNGMAAGTVDICRTYPDACK